VAVLIVVAQQQINAIRLFTKTAIESNKDIDWTTNATLAYEAISLIKADHNALPSKCHNSLREEKILFSNRR